MRTIIKLAWRNIWRNKKRAFLTMFSVIIAIALSLFTKSMQSGTFGSMIDNAVKLSSGYIQIQKDGYWENRSINETLEYSDSIKQVFEKSENVSFIVPRLESFALTSSGEQTKGTMVTGTIPEVEDELNKYSKRIVKGEYLTSNDKSILIGDELAKFLKVDVGDSLVLLGQGYHGVTAAAQYPIKGILHFPIPELNKQFVLMPLKECQYFFASENRVTSVSLMLNDPKMLDQTTAELRSNLSNITKVMTWKEMNTELLQFIDSKLIGGLVMLSILYLVVGFGVFGTVMMMTMERRKEFAIMVAIGMKKIKVVSLVFWETVFIGFVAMSIGLLITYPIILYLSYNPIPLTGEFAKSMELVGAEPVMPFIAKPEIFINQSIFVILVSMIAVIYPLIYILKFNVQKAMRS